MNEIIRQRARELGFDDCRVTTAKPPQSAPQFRRWLEEGRQGEIAYLERSAHKRVDPELVLPGAKSIITLAASYQTRKSRVQSHDADTTHHPPLGLTARYARYEDYHNLLTGPLKELAALVDRLGGTGTRSLWYVDTGPLLERDLGQRAGLGFIGKHTNLINRHLGNWFFLSEIITTLVLTPDESERNRCGSCARCLAACPTMAITAPFELDARRCISYLTIELKGPIPIEWRRAIGNRVFGCDVCLEVCPWNRFAQEGRLMQPHARPEFAVPDLVELLSLDEAGFKRHFSGTPMLRVKRRGLMRNVCVALGNMGDHTAMPALQRAAADPEPLVVEHARWAVGQIEQRGV
jgi:epoxyqueuosine reductase